MVLSANYGVLYLYTGGSQMTSQITFISGHAHYVV